MNSTVFSGVTSLAILIGSTSLWAQNNASQDFSNIWNIAKEEGSRALTIAKIKAAYADRKDIAGRYIRIRFDGKTLQLAGFVPNGEVGSNAVEIAKAIANPKHVQTFLAIDTSVPIKDTYNTYLGDQSRDQYLKAKVLTSLAGPAVHPQLKHAEIVHVGVDHGNVIIYIVADAEPTTFELAPFVKPIEGVQSMKVIVVKTF
jgi:hypothetical protein